MNRGVAKREHVGQEGGKRNVAVAAPVHLDDRPKPVVSRQVAGGNGTRIGFGRGPDEECVAGILRRDRFDLQDLRGAWRCQWIENLGAIVRFVYSQKDQRGPILHDQDGRKNQSRDVENDPV